MDIASLKAELEQHLKGNPHKDAPDGFRDRFEQLVELYKVETDAGDKSEMEGHLYRIRDEAEAATKAAGSGGRDSPGTQPPPPKAPGTQAPRPEVPRPGTPGPWLALGKGRAGVLLAAVAAAAAAAFYFYSGG
jgi:hypothetical protein